MVGEITLADAVGGDSRTGLVDGGSVIICVEYEGTLTADVVAS